MKTRIRLHAGAAVLAVAAAGLMAFGPLAPAAGAEEHQLPGMCRGRSDANVVLNAHANGARPAGIPKYILNITTDNAGHPSGTLIVGQGPKRLLVEDWCRFWQHQPNSGGGGGGQCEGDEGHNPDEDIVNAHAVGIAMYQGEKILVRTDVREDEDGKKVFRVRYRAIGGHHEEATALEDDGCDDDGCSGEGGDDGGCEGGGWTRIPAEEGWAPLSQLKVRPAE